MKIMSFNTQHCLNYLKQEIDFEIMAAAIRQADPDIVGLQEMRGQGEDPEYTEQIKTLSELSGMEYAYFAEAIRVDGDNPYGNGLLSKLPLLHAETIAIPDPLTRPYSREYESRCLLKAVLPDNITIMVCHFGLNPDEAQNAVDTILANLPGERCVLMGDFNLNPDSPILDPLRARMKDASEKFTAPLLSWPSDNPQRKIDYIFVTSDVEVLEADIPAIVASDHRPHTAVVRF